MTIHNGDLKLQHGSVICGISLNDPATNENVTISGMCGEPAYPYGFNGCSANNQECLNLPYGTPVFGINVDSKQYWGFTPEEVCANSGGKKRWGMCVVEGKSQQGWNTTPNAVWGKLSDAEKAKLCPTAWPNSHKNDLVIDPVTGCFKPMCPSLQTNMFKDFSGCVKRLDLVDSAGNKVEVHQINDLGGLIIYNHKFPFPVFVDTAGNYGEKGKVYGQDEGNYASGYPSLTHAGVVGTVMSNEISIEKNREYGGLIFSNSNMTNAGLTKAVEGTHNETPFDKAFPFAPSGSIHKGYYHTHGDYSLQNGARATQATDENSSDHFSSRDITSISKNPNKQDYLGTPSREFKQYIDKSLMSDSDFNIQFPDQNGNRELTIR